MKVGRPGPDAVRIERTIKADQARRNWRRNHHIFWVLTLQLLYVLVVCWPIFTQQFTYTFSPKQLETGVVVRHESRGTSKPSWVAILNIRGQEVVVWDDAAWAVGQSMAVLCTSELRCRKQDFWSQNGGHLLLGLVVLAFLTTGLLLLRFRALVQS